MIFASLPLKHFNLQVGKNTLRPVTHTPGLFRVTAGDSKRGERVKLNPIIDLSTRTKALLGERDQHSEARKSSGKEEGM